MNREPGSSGRWALQGIDARVKIVSALLLVFLAASVEYGDITRLMTYALMVFILILLSGLSFRLVLARSLVAVPFILFAAASLPFSGGREVSASWSAGPFTIGLTREGVSVFLSVLLKSLVSVLTLSILVSSTSVPQLISAARSLKAPRIMLLIISFMCRYLEVISEEVSRMGRARDSRSAGRGLRRNMAVAGNIIGNLFIRSYERAERVYLSMVSRGYSGEIRTVQSPGISAREISLFTLFAFIAAVVRFA